MPSFYLEESRTPIYRRISRALGLEISARGHDVFMVKPDGFDAFTFREFIKSRTNNCVYIANSGGNLINKRIPGSPEFFFELFPGKIIFLHQDNILGGISLIEAIAHIQAWQRLGERSAHLCIEPQNVKDLKAIGVNAFLSPHASEFSINPPTLNDFQYGASFVGHVVPASVRPALPNPAIAKLAESAMFTRQAHFGAALLPVITDWARVQLAPFVEKLDITILELATIQWVRNHVTALSMPLRGWVLEQCSLSPIAVFGGDPAYLHGIKRELRLSRPGIQYQKSIFEPTELQNIYNRSQISINISSLQFDYAVVNRVHDIFLAGGFCLTDALSGLEALTRHHADISFQTLEDLRDKALYFSHPTRRTQRSALIREIQKDIIENSGYPIITNLLLNAIKSY